MVSEKLKGCPFCGGEASLTIPSEHVQADCADIYVSCDECEAEGQRFVVEMKDRTPDLWPYEQRDAIAAWNTRAPADLRSALEAETIERCAKVCEQLAAGCRAELKDPANETRTIAVLDGHISACTALAANIRALAPTKGDVS